MNSGPPFDLDAAHKWLAADCFNRVWGYMGKPVRSAEEDERMISLSHASLAHWRERPDGGPRQFSVGYWQLSRVYALLGQAENAAHYGRLCLDEAAEQPPFYAGYAHEALARAAKVAGHPATLHEHLSAAHALAAKVENGEERQWLLTDLESLAL